MQSYCHIKYGSDKNELILNPSGYKEGDEEFIAFG